MKLLRTLALAGICAGLAPVTDVTAQGRAGQAPPAESAPPSPGRADAPTEERKALVDENWKIGASNMKATFIAAPAATRIRVSVEGVANYGKGFTVRVMPKKVWSDYLAGKVTTKGLADYPAEVTGRYGRTLTFEPGQWAVAVQNSENFLKSLTVHVVVREPREDRK